MNNKHKFIISIIISLLLGASYLIYTQVQNEINKLEIAEFNKRILAFNLTKVKIENYLKSLHDKITIAAFEQAKNINQLISEPNENYELLELIQANISKKLPNSFISTFFWNNFEKYSRVSLTVNLSSWRTISY